jgi:hypothetical protein
MVINNSKTRVNPPGESTHTKASPTKQNARNANVTQLRTISQTGKQHKKPFYHEFKSDVVIHTNKSRRAAKKRFIKSKQAPNGTVLLYSVRSFINGNPPLPDSVIRQQEIVNELSHMKFRKSYNKLTSSEQTKVFEALNDSGKKTETIH